MKAAGLRIPEKARRGDNGKACLDQHLKPGGGERQRLPAAADKRAGDEGV